MVGKESCTQLLDDGFGTGAYRLFDFYITEEIFYGQYIETKPKFICKMVVDGR